LRVILAALMPAIQPTKSQFDNKPQMSPIAMLIRSVAIYLDINLMAKTHDGLYVVSGADRQLKDIKQPHHDVPLHLVGEN
jgi:hypothetical protein